MDRRGFLFSCPAALVVACTAQPAMTAGQDPDPFAVSLALSVLGGQMVQAKLMFRNVAQHPALLFKSFLTTGAQNYGDWFRITANGQPVRFKGRMVKRAAPGPDDFLTLAPGETAQGEFVLNYCYEIPFGSNVLAQFTAFNASLDDQPLMKLQSNVAEIAGA